jgi:predicted ester cyclase
VSQQNKEIVTRWFGEYWGKGNPDIVDELRADDLLFRYPMQGELHRRDAVKKLIIDFGAAFPDVTFEVTAPLVAEGDYVAGRWAGGTHTGLAFDDLPLGPLPEASSKKIHFSGTTAH